jgi:hypothetical protein
MRNRRTLPSRQRTYIRLRARIDHLEDAISHFYNVINELRRRVSTLGDRVSGTDADRHENISHNGNCGFGGNAGSAETADLRPCTH